MTVQKESKSPNLSRTLVLSSSFLARASAEELVFLGVEDTCFKHDFGTPGKIDCCWVGYTFNCDPFTVKMMDTSCNIPERSFGIA